ncbi:hypothetical protein A4D02_13635 [Niastella koreensis]|uniref:DUF4907 domain-containing protein n=2 Tax=Niastella koreensis TaxID=354356 RepID=G8TNR9_NIAKG|nr:DUF4907 domain-containing protein [Niastella koreensis]AEW00995.1 hypothetical protein Niako_4739 [Niastella koreensis GR20-10]OQP42602.1 hypothetical protein A4D02_13635 [Niastella koreensis]
MLLQRTISKHQIFVLLAALVIAAGSTFYILVKKKPAPPAHTLHYSTFHTGHGWGYDILVDTHIVIHQPMQPGKSGYDGYPTESAAQAEAQNVIESIKSGTHPFFGQKQTQRPGVSSAQPK